MKGETRKYLKIGIVAFLFFLVIYYWGTISDFGKIILYSILPFVGGFVIAYIVNIPMIAIEKKVFGRFKNKVMRKLKRPISMIIAFAAVSALVYLIIRLILPEIISCIELLIKEVPPKIETMYLDFDKKYGLTKFFTENFGSKFGGIKNWNDVITKGIDVFVQGFSGIMDSVIGAVIGIFSTVFSIFMSFVFSVYILFSKEKLENSIDRLFGAYLPAKAKDALDKIVNTANYSFHNFIVGQCTEAVILGVLCIVGMKIFGFPYATMIGTLIGFTALIPVAGAYIGAAVGALMIFTASSWFDALLFIVFIIVLQQLEGNLIYPKVVGASIGLPGIWVLVAVSVGAAVGGIPAILLSVPIFATVYKLLGDDVNARRRKVKEKTEQEF